MTNGTGFVGTLTDMEQAMLEGAGYDSDVRVFTLVSEDDIPAKVTGYVAVVTRDGDKVVESLGRSIPHAIGNALRSLFR